MTLLLSVPGVATVTVYCGCGLGRKAVSKPNSGEQKLAHAEAFFGCCLTKLLKVL